MTYCQAYLDYAKDEFFITISLSTNYINNADKLPWYMNLNSGVYHSNHHQSSAQQCKLLKVTNLLAKLLAK